jgi:hypothetical protein
VWRDIEHVDHIFFQCPLAQFLWSGVRDMFGVSWHPSSRLDWFIILDSLSPKAQRAVWTYFAAQCWAIWITGNKFTIERKFPRQPADCIFKLTLSLQLCRPLQRNKDKGMMDELISMTKVFFATSYSPPSPLPSA